MCFLKKVGVLVFCLVVLMRDGGKGVKNVLVVADCADNCLM